MVCTGYCYIPIVLQRRQGTLYLHMYSPHPALPPSVRPSVRPFVSSLSAICPELGLQADEICMLVFFFVFLYRMQKKHNQQSTIHNPQSTIHNPQSQIPPPPPIPIPIPIPNSPIELPPFFFFSIHISIFYILYFIYFMFYLCYLRDSNKAQLTYLTYLPT